MTGNIGCIKNDGIQVDVVTMETGQRSMWTHLINGWAGLHVESAVKVWSFGRMNRFSCPSPDLLSIVLLLGPVVPVGGWYKSRFLSQMPRDLTGCGRQTRMYALHHFPLKNEIHKHLLLFDVKLRYNYLRLAQALVLACWVLSIIRIPGCNAQ